MKIIPIACSFDNYSYLLICEKTQSAAVVDPTEFYPVFKAIEENGVKLQAVLCTHHHHDHIGGLAELCEEFDGVEVYGFKGDAHRIPGLTQLLDDGDSLQVGELQGQVLFTPGHTTGSICYLFDEALFTGDTLFGCGCGRLFEGTPSMMFNSLMQKIFPLPDNTRIYFGHEYTIVNLRFAEFVDSESEAVKRRLGEAQGCRERQEATSPSTLGLEKETNPFLRCTDELFAGKVAEKLVCEDSRPETVFAAIRKLRDGFS